MLALEELRFNCEVVAVWCNGTVNADHNFEEPIKAGKIARAEGLDHEAGDECAVEVAVNPWMTFTKGAE